VSLGEGADEGHDNDNVAPTSWRNTSTTTASKPGGPTKEKKRKMPIASDEVPVTAAIVALLPAASARIELARLQGVAQKILQLYSHRSGRKRREDQQTLDVVEPNIVLYEQHLRNCMIANEASRLEWQQEAGPQHRGQHARTFFKLHPALLPGKTLKSKSKQDL
jgi:hypothetical protein